MNLLDMQEKLIKELKVKKIEREYVGNMSNIKHVTEYYDVNGNLESSIVGNCKTDYFYMNNKLITEKCVENDEIVEIVSYMYEGDNVIEILDGTKNKEYIYINGLLIQKIYYYCNEVRVKYYNYDNNGNLIQEDDFNSIIKYTYDENNNLTSRTVFTKSSLPCEGFKSIYEYKDNSIVLCHYNGMKTEYIFDENKLLICYNYINIDGDIEDKCIYTYEFHN